MTTVRRGRQHPDDPLEVPPGQDRLPRGAGDLLSGWPDSSLDFWPEAAGAFLASMLGGTPEPGPPYVHTFTPPEPAGWDDDGNPLYPEPGPPMTLTGG